MFTTFEFILHGLIGLVAVLPTCILSRFRAQPRSDLYTGINLSNRVVIVTGSNTGIGRETANTLALLGATVILACRDEAKGQAAAADINRERLLKGQASKEHRSYGEEKSYIGSGTYSNALHGKAVYMHLDLASFASILRFVERIKETYDQVDILVNNAGVNISGRTENNLEQLFQINYLGHFLLFALLQPLLSAKNSLGRVVNLSSVMHHAGTVSFLQEDYPYHSAPQKYSNYYGDSKLYMTLLTLAINFRFHKGSSDISSVACNPGAVRSDIWRHIPRWLQGLYDIFMRIIYLSVEQGSLTSIHAATMTNEEIKAYAYRYRHLLNASDVKTLKWTYHPYLPYIIPYNVPVRLLCFEMIGPMSKPHCGEVSVPKGCNLVCEDLWKVSADICLDQLKSLVDNDKFSEMKTLLKY